MPEPLAVTAEDLDVTARTLWGEARGEPLTGQQAVAWVIRNRAAWRPAAWWGNTPKAACLKHAQFSCWLETDPNRAGLLILDTESPAYLALLGVARAVFAGEVDDPTGGATHYQVRGTGAAWSRGRAPSAVIGRHEFYAIGPHE